MLYLFAVLAFILGASSGRAYSLFDADSGSIFAYKLEGEVVHGLLCQNVPRSHVRRFVQNLPAPDCQELVPGGVTQESIAANMTRVKEVISHKVDESTKKLSAVAAASKDPGQAALFLKLAQTLGAQAHAKVERLTPQDIYQSFVVDAQTRQLVIEVSSDIFIGAVDKFLLLDPK